MIRVAIATITFSVLAAGVVHAQNADAIKQRQAVFKTFGDAAKTGTGMVRGQAKFDLAAAKKAFSTYSDGSKKLRDLFPDNSKVGAETEALPVIWEKKGDFMTLLAKFESEAGAAAASIKDEASFKDAWPKVMGNCGTCHKAYRKPKS